MMRPTITSKAVEPLLTIPDPGAVEPAKDMTVPAEVLELLVTVVGGVGVKEPPNGPVTVAGVITLAINSSFSRSVSKLTDIE